MAKSSSLAAEHAGLSAQIHDLIGHKLSLMVLHASALELTGGQQAARATLIRETGHAAILSLQEILAGLDDGSVPAQRMVERGPLATLAELVRESRDAGLSVELRTGPSLDQLPSEAAELLCAVVREALTNVHKHAGVVPTAVTVEVLGDRLVIDVGNEPPAARPATAHAGSHRGLRGLRQRLAHWDGWVTGETRPDGGFRLHAELPMWSCQ
ncbi:sensor histidine kinase [Kutzneria sp. CA-103260]|uniref:sensor histidine kinase n=1 Tax=Kutzneria sp. CA-103260 TaxID=2802641 RepID=UPI001BAC999D|nr:sensor histidine kinase [Kutzneria sp. CA-103260]QUQ65540.1 two-component sensor histidine kinase [Kutzneria sp. CA-103260]